MHVHTWQSEPALSRVHKVSPQYQSHPMALRGWLHMLLHWGLPRFTAYNCLPLHRCRFSKYDSLILMCLGKHNPNTNAALHAWANRCRCRLIISPTCTLSWSINSREDLIFASLPVHRSASLWLITSKPAPVSWSRTLCLKEDNTCPIFNGNVVLEGCLVSAICRCVKRRCYILKKRLA